MSNNDLHSQFADEERKAEAMSDKNVFEICKQCNTAMTLKITSQIVRVSENGAMVVLKCHACGHPGKKAVPDE